MFVPIHTKLNSSGMEKLHKRMQEIPFKYFLPTYPQADLYRRIGDGVGEGKRIFLVTSGNGAGKSAGVINLLANLAWPEHGNIFRNIIDYETGELFTGFFDYPFFQNYPRTWPKRARYVSNKEVLNQVIWPEIQQWIPEYLYDASKDGKGYISKIDFIHSDWKVSIMTDEQDPKTFEGANIGVTIFDDSMDYRLYTASISRTRKGGIIVIPCTPLFGASWFVDEIIEKMADGDKVHQAVSVWSNCIERAGFWDCGLFGLQPKGALWQQNIQMTLNNYPPDEKEARENGTFMYMAGMVYKNYQQTTHMTDIPPVTNPAYYMYRMILDPHDRKPPAAVWVRMDRYGRRDYVREWPSIYDEEYQPGHGNKRYFHQIKDAYPLRMKDFVQRWVKIMRDELHIPEPGKKDTVDRIVCIIDPNFGNKISRKTGLPLWQEYKLLFENEGWPMDFITNAIDDLHTGHMTVREKLRPTNSGDLLLRIDSKCANIDWSFRNYRYDDWEGKTATKKTVKEDVQEHGKDFMDCIRYDIMVPFSWVEHTKIFDDPDDQYGGHKDDIVRPEQENSHRVKRPHGVV